MGDRTRKRIEENLRNSATEYADHVENTISKLQQAYFKKYYQGGYYHSAHVPRHPQDAPNKRFGDKVSTLFRGKRGFKHTELEETGTDTSNLKVSFRRALSLSIPPPALYHNHHLGAYSNLIFGVPLSECMTDGDYVPKVIRMCIEEVEKRGLNTYEIYSVGAMYDPELRRRLESEQTFSFSCKDNIHSIATLLKLYLWDLPEPLCTLPLRDYIQYGQNRGALCLHLSLVASYSDKNAMSATALAFRFGFCVFSGCTKIFPSGVRMKDLLMEDLIQNAHTLFDEHLPPFPSPHSVRPEETASVLSYSSYLSPRSFEAQIAGPSTYLSPGPVGSVRAFGRYSPSISPSNSSIDHLGGTTPTTLTPLLSSLPEMRGSYATKALPNTPQDVVSWPHTFAAQQGIPPQQPYPEALTIPQGPPESMPPSSADETRSSATSLQSTTGAFH
ncbi:Rho GTPase activation protein [Lactarius psammicola]|nr:Rho GTPase activation protein [Lactarius psammicola]